MPGRLWMGLFLSACRGKTVSVDIHMLGIYPRDFMDPMKLGHIERRTSVGNPIFKKTRIMMITCYRKTLIDLDIHIICFGRTNVVHYLHF